MPNRGGDGRCALTFGYDATLISSRQRLLEKTGCTSLVASSMQEFQEALSSHAVDLVVICQTVSPEECHAVTRMVTEQAPRAQMLIMYNRHDYCRPAGPAGSYVLFDSMSGPSNFVETAERMLLETATHAVSRQRQDAFFN